MTKLPANLVGRLANFRKKSRQERLESYGYRWLRWFPRIPAPVRHPSGAWWLMDNDFIGESLLKGGYEQAEMDFATRFLKPGMTVLDIGAHRGFHTLFFSKKVGRLGHVISMEPSPVDRKRLQLHLRINFCRNVRVVDYAVGEENEKANLYAVPTNSVLNSLRPPDTDFETAATAVVVRKLDDIVSEMKVEAVDFVKLDVEGGELGVLKGAQGLLRRVPRPVILCEVLEQRTRPWGYRGSAIIEYLAQMDFAWFELSERGGLLPIPREQAEFSGNFVAVPKESLSSITNLHAPTQ
jgi:FkbM family methyltransferase